MVLRDAAALSLLKQMGRLACVDLQAKLGVSKQAARRTIERLCQDGKASTVMQGRSLFLVSGTPPPKAEKRVIEYLPYTGVDWSNATDRPGCQDFLSLPSLQQGRETPHKLPIYGCVATNGVNK